MRYFVIGQDGVRYGPADLATLSQWASEGRVVPATTLEEEGTGLRVVAAQLGISFPPGMPSGSIAGAPFQEPYPGYVRPGKAASTSDGQTELTWAWVLGAVGIFCCPIGFCTAGAIMAVQAKNKGHRGATAALVFCIVAGVVSITVGIVLNPFTRLGFGGPR